MATVKQMYDYLRLATIMEGDVYAAKRLLLLIENEVGNLQSEEYYTQENYDWDMARINVSQKKKKLIPTWAKIYFTIAIFCSICTLFSEGGIKFFLLVSSVYAVFFFIILGISLHIKKKDKNAATEEKRQIEYKLAMGNIIRRDNENKIEIYKVQYSEAKSGYLTAVDNLNKLYSDNLLPVKYRNYSAVATMYQWLRDGRCTQIYGHGGLFDTYEYDLRIGTIIGNLEQINRKLDIMIDNQQVLISEVRRSNEIAERTFNSVNQAVEKLKSIDSTATQIKTNTDIMAMNSNYQTRLQEYAYYRSLYY